MGQVFSFMSDTPQPDVVVEGDTNTGDVKDEQLTSPQPAQPSAQLEKRSYADVVRGRGMNDVHQKQEMCEKV